MDYHFYIFCGLFFFFFTIYDSCNLEDLYVNAFFEVKDILITVLYHHNAISQNSYVDIFEVARGTIDIFKWLFTQF